MKKPQIKTPKFSIGQQKHQISKSTTMQSSSMILKNYDWLGHLGIKCRCGTFKITAKDSINCESLKKTTSNTQIIPQIKKALSENNIEDLSKISEDKHATPVFEFLVKMQQDAQKKYIYEKNTSKKTREDSSQRKPTLKSTRN